MLQRKRWVFVVLIIAGLGLSACTQQPVSVENQPVHLEPIEGTDLNRVILTEKAAERLDIQMTPVRNEQVRRYQVVNGEVIAPPKLTTVITSPTSGTILAPSAASIPITGSQLSAGQSIFRLSPLGRLSVDQSVMNIDVPADTVLLRLLVSPGQFVETGQALFEVADLSEVLVRVPVTEGEFNRMDRGQSAHILLLGSDDADEGLEAEAVEGPNGDEVEDADESGDVDRALYYGVDNAERSLALEQSVRVMVPLSGSGTKRIVIPYAAVIYGPNGETWVYTNPEPLVFVRRPILIDYIEGDQAFLSVGPPSGGEVVTVGAEELYGSESEFAEE